MSTTPMKRLHVRVDAEIADWLASESIRTGAPVGELIRRAVRIAKYGEAQTSKPRRFTPAVETRQQPVLLTSRKEDHA